MNNKHKKALNFDLDTKALKQYYSNKNYRKAYEDIKNFLLVNGFEHRQYSGYISVKPMSDATIRAKILKMKKVFPWLKKCVNHFDVTDIGRQHDLTHIIRNNNKNIDLDKKQSNHRKKCEVSINQIHKNAERIKKSSALQHRKSKSKDLEL